jgi:hypothetical protein
MKLPFKVSQLLLVPIDLINRHTDGWKDVIPNVLIVCSRGINQEPIIKASLFEGRSQHSMVVDQLNVIEVKNRDRREVRNQILQDVGISMLLMHGESIALQYCHIQIAQHAVQDAFGVAKSFSQRFCNRLSTLLSFLKMQPYVKVMLLLDLLHGCLMLLLRLLGRNLRRVPNSNDRSDCLHPARINHEPARRFPQPAKITHSLTLPSYRNAVLGVAIRTDQGLDFAHSAKCGKRMFLLLHKTTGTRKAIMVSQPEPSRAEGLNCFRRSGVVFHPRHQVSKNPRILHFGAPL